jgi:hypothetical protein
MTEIFSGSDLKTIDESLLIPIQYGENEGQDKVTPGQNTQTNLVDARLNGSMFNSNNQLRTGITSPTLIGEVSAVEGTSQLVEANINDALDRAATHIENGTGGSHKLTLYRGFVSPENQQMRWKTLYGTRPRNSAAEEIDAGDHADSVGSVAELIKDEQYEAELKKLMADSALHKELQKAFGKEDVTAEFEKLLKYRANNGQIQNVKIDISTATTVHNLGQSVNVGLANNEQMQHIIGVGLDILSPAQQVDYFENITPEKYIALVEQNPMLETYLRSLGVTRIDHELIEKIRNNRRILHNAMKKQGFDFYRGETGHYTQIPESGEFPSREHVYQQARKSGYSV